MHTRTRAISLLACLALAALACNFSSSTQANATPPPPEMSLTDALATAPEDRRPEVLRLMGSPDSITITWQALEGQTVRLEEWSYYDAETRFDFVDGELAWTIDIDPAPDGSLFAHLYHPLDFDSTMTIDDVKAMLSDQVLVEESLAEADVPGGLALVGDQILLGFDGGHLAFVQTFVLSPDGQTAAGPATDGAQVSPTTEPATGAGASILLEDDFEGSSPARALFGAEYMAFAEQSGEGVLTSLSPGGVVPIIYDQPIVADFALEVDVRLPQAESGSAIGVILRSDPAAGGLDFYYHFSFLPAAGEVKLEMWKDGRWSTLADSPIPVGVIVPGAIDRLRVEADGPALRLYVNGTPLLDAEEDSLASPGIIGLSLVAGEVPDSVYFDNLRIEALDE